MALVLGSITPMRVIILQIKMLMKLGMYLMLGLEKVDYKPVRNSSAYLSKNV